MIEREGDPRQSAERPKTNGIGMTTPSERSISNPAARMARRSVLNVNSRVWVMSRMPRLPYSKRPSSSEIRMTMNPILAVVRISLCAAARGKRTQLVQKILRRGEMLDHVERKDVVEALARHFGQGSYSDPARKKLSKRSGEGAALDVAA